MLSADAILERIDSMWWDKFRVQIVGHRITKYNLNYKKIPKNELELAPLLFIEIILTKGGTELS